MEGKTLPVSSFGQRYWTSSVVFTIPPGYGNAGLGVEPFQEGEVESDDFGHVFDRWQNMHAIQDSCNTM